MTYITTVSNSSYYYEIEIPKKCPSCEAHMIPEINKISDEAKVGDYRYIGVLVRCIECNHFYALNYKVGSMNAVKKAYETSYIPNNYTPYIELDLPKEILDYSPIFVEIYKQSQLAEKYNLNQISGMGYRKAIEFLVKDFLINFQSCDKEEIEKLPLLQSIKKLPDQRLINLATAAAFLGNDQSHYKQKFEDRDINGLKKFLIAFVAYFVMEETLRDSDNILSN